LNYYNKHAQIVQKSSTAWYIFSRLFETDSSQGPPYKISLLFS